MKLPMATTIEIGGNGAFVSDDRVHTIAFRFDLSHRLAITIADTAPGAGCGEALGELVAIPNLIAGEIERSRQRRFCILQGRFDVDAAVWTDPLVEQSMSGQIVH